MHEFLRERPIIGKQEQAFALLVETSHMEEVSGIRGEEIEDRPFSMTVAASGDIARRFVEQNRAGRNGMDNSSVDPHIILGVDARCQIADKGAVKGNSSLENVLLAGAS